MLLPLRDNIPTDRIPFITILLILANVCIYFFVQDGGLTTVSTSSVLSYGAVPNTLTSTEIVHHSSTVFTSMFMHGSVFHLAGNMLFLWIFGNNIEDSLGRVRFIGFYLAGGLLALVAQVAIDPNSQTPLIGASGAIAAVLGAYLMLFPRARVVTLVLIVIFFTVIELPALIVIVVWAGLQILYGVTALGNPVSGGIAYFAHIGGFVFGLIAIRSLVQKNKETAASASYSEA